MEYKGKIRLQGLSNYFADLRINNLEGNQSVKMWIFFFQQCLVPWIKAQKS